MSKIVITCAVTGSIHTPSMSPYLPLPAEQITTDAVAAAEAAIGLAILVAFFRARGSIAVEDINSMKG